VYTKLREKIVFKRFQFISSDANGVLAGYVHVPANDKIGVLVELEAASADEAKSEAAQSIGRELAMQIAASRPKYTTRDEVPETIIAQEKDIAASTARADGKPEAAIEKIVEGRVRKYYEETVLVDQAWLREPKKTVAQVLKEHKVSLRRYVRYSVGEQTGVETSGAIKESVE
jgi:elongation factor Ts